MDPVVTFPLIRSRSSRRSWCRRGPARPSAQYEQVSIWWMLPFAGVLTFLLGQQIPYYRFMNATAAPMALAGLGSFVAVRWLYRGDGLRRVAGALGALVVVGALAWVFIDPAMNRWAQQDNQWAPQSVRTSLAAAREVVVERRRTAERPDRELREHRRRDGLQHDLRMGEDLHERLPDGAARQLREVSGHLRRHRRGLPPRRPVRRTERELPGDVREPLEGAAASARHLRRAARRLPDRRVLRGEMQRRPARRSARPMRKQAAFERATADAIEIGPGAYVLTGDGVYEPPAEVVERARDGGRGGRRALRRPPGSAGQPPASGARPRGPVRPRRVAGSPRRAVLRSEGHAEPDRADPRHLDRDLAVVRDRGAGRVARRAHRSQGVDRGRGRRRRGGRSALRRRGDPARRSIASAGSSTACSRSSRTATSRR